MKYIVNVKNVPIFTTDKGVNIGFKMQSVFVSWEDLPDLVTTLQNLELDKNGSEILEHEYQSL